MENRGGSFADRVHLGEGNDLEDESLKPRVGNGVSRVSDDNEMKDKEADEVFEEAMQEEVNTPARQLEEQEQKESEVKAFVTVGDVIEENLGERMVNGDTPSGHEIEPMEVPTDDVHHVDIPVAVEEKVDNVDHSDAALLSVGAETSKETQAPIETNGSGTDDSDTAKGDDHIVEEAPVVHVNGGENTCLDKNLPEEMLLSENGKFDSIKSSAPDVVVLEKSENVASDGMRTDSGPRNDERTVEVPLFHVDEEMRVDLGVKQPEEGFESENGCIDVTGSSIACVTVRKNSENEDSEVKVEKNEQPSEVENKERVCSLVEVEIDKQIPHHGQAEIVEETSVAAENNNAEEIEITQEETSSSQEVCIKVDKKNETTENDRGLSHGINTHTELVAVNQGGDSERPEMGDVTDDSVPVEVLCNLEEKDTPQASFLENSDVNRLSEGDFVSIEEYDESSSTDEENSDSVVGKSSGKPEDAAPAPAPAPAPIPAGLGSSAPLRGPPSRVSQQPRANGTVQHQHAQTLEESANGETEEYDETREKLQMIRVKFLRLAHRLGQTPHNVVVAQVLYRLGLAEQLRGSRTTTRAGAFSFDRASAMAVQLEAAGQEALDFSCTIMVLGKTGVGKSATINSIFDENRFTTDAFQPTTKKVQDITGTVQGIKVRIIDTPGLLSSSTDQRQNEKILLSVKRFIKKTPPDIVLYLDRLDMQSRDFGDVPLLRTITDIFGLSIWFNAIVVLTHASSAPPDGPNGTPLSYEMFVTQRSHVVQQAIRQVAGDVRLMNPVSLVENHLACRTNRAGQRVLPNGQVWKPQLLLLSFASKILAEANTLLKLQDSPPGKPFGTRSRIPPLPFLLSSLLQSRPQLKLPEEQFGDDDNINEDLDETSDSEAESEYDELPPFKRLTKSQLAKLSKAQKKAYYDELEYREKLFMKKQLKEEKKRRKLLKKMFETASELPSDHNENEEEESGGAASVPVPMPDLALPTSFDSDNPTHRYRYLDSSNQWLVRPVLENHGWDHDVGYEGINVERLFVVKDQIPVSCSGQVVKDKKECNLQMEVASSVKHGEGKATSVGLDMQTVGKDLAYTFRSETKFSNFRRNKMAAGLSVTMLGEALTAGMKLEDVLMLHKRFRLVMTGGAMTCRGDVAYGGSLEATLRDKDYPLGRTLSTLGLSIMDWHGDLAIGCNVQSQFPVGRTTNMVARANLNNKGAGQVSLRLSSSEQLQIALFALIPLIRNITRLYGYSSQEM
ncbi:translocase of chloroplast 101, chloroplastic-like [Aristolochia californica]|uniref:translocase of chloroplast 101, chloroplastic-like n=1 Tax=Aristolochia californica TaxID=171875 RepID=UPI0035E1E476